MPIATHGATIIASVYESQNMLLVADSELGRAPGAARTPEAVSSRTLPR